MTSHPSRGIAALIDLMARLRDPLHGCPWDKEQTFSSIAVYTLEEAHEVADAIARNDLHDLRDELGDLLLQVVFHARMAEERGAFHFDDVVDAIISKLLRRHPHVFGGAEVANSGEVGDLWKRIKAAERAEKQAAKGEADDGRQGALASVPAGLPAFARALKLQDKAAEVGFDWPSVGPVLDKIEEELGELRAAVTHSAGGKVEAVSEELGDLLFAAVNVARHVGVNPESVLRAANLKFERRFAAVENGLAAAGKSSSEATLEEMEALWVAVKAAEK